MRLLPIAAACLALMVLAAPAPAQQGLTPLNDLLALGQEPGDVPDPAPIEKPPAPPIKPAPRADCGPGSKPEPDVQGRVPAGSATGGLWCNLALIAHHGVSGGYRVYDYVDKQGRECAFYDTALVFPSNAFNLNSSSVGVAVLDMSNPAKPVQTDTLTEPAMLSPHESFNLNPKRGLLAAVSGNPATYPGYVSIYDASKDCRHPVLQSSGPLARLGHEGAFSEDGRTYYATGTAYKAITAIDVTDPKSPHVVWQGSVQSHGMGLSNDGNRAYLANPDVQYGDMIILDTSEIQARKDKPHTREISRITWDRISIPQNAIPFTAHGKPYVLEFDEFNASTLDPSGDPNMVGAGRIIDISDERNPRIVSYLRLQVNEPEEHEKFKDDPGADGPANGGGQGYALHYCNIPTRVDPKIVACSFIVSGLRLFDISDLTKPREIGYYVAPTQAKAENQGQASDYAMSQPAFVPERREIWFTDATGGFYSLRVSDRIWPKGADGGACLRPSKIGFKLHRVEGTRIVRVEAFANGRRVLRRTGSDLRRVELSGLKRGGRLHVRIVSTHNTGSKVISTRSWNGCKKGKPKVRAIHRR
ncbi:MAG TPA: hypothetical protein VF712_02375 [Thermoleophilaceae bacterium]|jgi:hypothetical protein